MWGHESNLFEIEGGDLIPRSGSQGWMQDGLWPPASRPAWDLHGTSTARRDPLGQEDEGGDGREGEWDKEKKE